MDRNNDGVITRDEWRGSEQSFNVRDWNGDGKLSGNEVRIGAARDDRASMPITSIITNENIFSTTGRTAGSGPSITIGTIASLR
jgi:hypothetical protein